MSRIIIIFCILYSFALSSCTSKMFDRNISTTLTHTTAVPGNIEVALVLGGGGARAIAEIGVIEVLVENNVPIDLIVGTSAGSIIGALYADNQDITHIKKICLNFKTNDLVKVSLKDALSGTRSLKGGLDSSAGERFVADSITSRVFQDLKIPLIVVATDLKSGQTIELNNGAIIPAIKASCAIPGLFSPVEMNGMILVDGCVSAPVGVYVAKKYNPSMIIAVDVSTPLGNAKIKNMFDVAHRSAYISYEALKELNVKAADILITPSMADIGIFEGQKNQEMYIAGRQAALKLMPKIKQLMYNKNIKTIKKKK